MRRLLVLVIALLMAAPAQARCDGENLIDALAPGQMATLRAAVDAVPYASGNFWRATRGSQTLHLIGTYHLDDPRHAQTMVALEPLIATSVSVLVEASPKEEAALKERIARDPGVMLITEGPTLPERLPAAEWAALSDALRARGIPPFVAAKFRPWYLSMVLGIPACVMDQAPLPRGLDARVIEFATAKGVPVKALEPFDTVFGLFDGMSDADQMAMVRSSLAMEPEAEDYTTTMVETYFAEEGRMIWEFTRLQLATQPDYTPERIEAEFSALETALMTRRNQAWMPVMLTEAAKGPVLAAFGALHLSGDQGVLALLAAEGFALQRLPF